ncbi:hypothetical protein K474DRAFT_1114307 [Panus rudis PR-1116 ss-1]|nr:hypothetical protein K474DRAFT_1114307 [Panus rudis PR-1116 ss-1]
MPKVSILPPSCRSNISRCRNRENNLSHSQPAVSLSYAHILRMDFSAIALVWNNTRQLVQYDGLSNAEHNGTCPSQLAARGCLSAWGWEAMQSSAWISDEVDDTPDAASDNPDFVFSDQAYDDLAENSEVEETLLGIPVATSASTQATMIDNALVVLQTGPDITTDEAVASPSQGIASAPALFLSTLPCTIDASDAGVGLSSPRLAGSFAPPDIRMTVAQVIEEQREYAILIS